MVLTISGKNLENGIEIACAIAKELSSLRERDTVYLINEHLSCPSPMTTHLHS